jgi:hypothetical protein
MVGIALFTASSLLAGGMYAMFFFLTQYFQGVSGFGPLEAGAAFLPMTLLVFTMVRWCPGSRRGWPTRACSPADWWSASSG